LNSNKRPLSVLVLSCLYIATGAMGFAYHFPAMMAREQYSVWIELVRLLAVVCGVFMLRGHNWARWLALVWMAFHVAISFPALGKVAFHLTFFVAIAWLLFRPDARRYFSSRGEAL
jgi:hypothetical protein